MKSNVFEGENVLVLGGTGSLGKTLIHTLLGGEYGSPQNVTLFSRDEAKQHDLRLAYLGNMKETDSAIYKSANAKLRFHIGDVRDVNSLAKAIGNNTIVIYAAALKQVPSCEYFPFEAVQTNVIGVENALKLTRGSKVHTFVGVSTDKAVAPVNVMGMTKALQERLVIQSNLGGNGTRGVVVRYGNVLSSRGSVIPLFLDQLEKGLPVTITDSRMTRFLLTLDEAVEIIVNAIAHGKAGDTLIPAAPSAKIVDLVEVLAQGRKFSTVEIGRRPGEKLHESLVSEEEGYRTERLNEQTFRIQPMLPELSRELPEGKQLNRELSSADYVMSIEELETFLRNRSVI